MPQLSLKTGQDISFSPLLGVVEAHSVWSPTTKSRPGYCLHATLSSSICGLFLLCLSWKAQKGWGKNTTPLLPHDNHESSLSHRVDVNKFHNALWHSLKERLEFYWNNGFVLYIWVSEEPCVAGLAGKYLCTGMNWTLRGRLSWSSSSTALKLRDLLPLNKVDLFSVMYQFDKSKKYWRTDSYLRKWLMRWVQSCIL